MDDAQGQNLIELNYRFGSVLPDIFLSAVTLSAVTLPAVILPGYPCPRKNCSCPIGEKDPHRSRPGQCKAYDLGGETRGILPLAISVPLFPHQLTLIS